MEILMGILRVYLATVALTLVSDMLVTARSQFYGISIKKGAALISILIAAIPIANLIVTCDNFMTLFNRKTEFIVKFMFVKGRLDELEVVDADGNKVDFDIEKFMKGE